MLLSGYIYQPTYLSTPQDSLPDLSINPQHDPALGEVKEEMDTALDEIETIYDKAKVRRTHKR